MANLLQGDFGSQISGAVRGVGNSVGGAVQATGANAPNYPWNAVRQISAGIQNSPGYALFQGATDPNGPYASFYSGLNNQATSLAKQLGIQNAMYSNDTGYTNQQYQNQLAQLGLQQQGLGIRQGALTRQTALDPKLQALTEQGFAAQKGNIEYGAGQQVRGLTSQATASGSLQTEGTRQAGKDIFQQLSYQEGELGRQKQGEELNYQEQQAQLKDAQQNLDIASKGLGIDKTQLQQSVQHALQQLGLTNQMNTQQVIDSLAQLQQQKVGPNSPMAQVLPYIMQAGGIPFQGL